jgi:hypothetical protein
MKVLFGWVSAILLVIALGVTIESTAQSPSLRSTIDQIAVNAASWEGDANPTSVTWQSACLESGQQLGCGGARAVYGYYLEIRGTFPGVGASVPGDPYRVATFPVMSVTVDDGSFDTIQIYVGNLFNGTFSGETDSLQGISPSSGTPRLGQHTCSPMACLPVCPPPQTTVPEPQGSGGGGGSVCTTLSAIPAMPKSFAPN